MKSYVERNTRIHILRRAAWEIGVGVNSSRYHHPIYFVVSRGLIVVHEILAIIVSADHQTSYEDVLGMASRKPHGESRTMPALISLQFTTILIFDQELPDLCIPVRKSKIDSHAKRRGSILRRLTRTMPVEIFRRLNLHSRRCNIEDRV